MRYGKKIDAGKRCVLMMAGDWPGVGAAAVAASGDVRCGRRGG
jgi:hypothetical protein